MLVSEVAFLNEAREILDERKSQRGGNEDQYAAARFEIISIQMNMDSSMHYAHLK